MQRGDIVVCVSSGDHGKSRPAVIVQADLFNKTHATLTVCPFTTHIIEAALFRLLISPTKQNGLKAASQIMVDKITSLRREKMHEKMGVLTADQMNQLDDAILLWLDLNLNNKG